MSATKQFINPAEAARRLGVSVKTLRLYEAQGLIAPVRTEAGWRTYGPAQMARAGEVVSLRKLGFSLKQVGRLLDGAPEGMDPLLAAHQSMLEGEAKRFAASAEKVSALRNSLTAGECFEHGDLARLILPPIAPAASFDLPWPWNGEHFDLPPLTPITYITGPLGSGKTRLAMKIAESLPGARFLGLDRTTQAAGDPTLCEATLTALEADGAERSDALIALLSGLAATGPLVVDMVEDGLDEATQEALIAHLRQRGGEACPLFLMTRSTAILDLDSVGPQETILYCPANHSPPIRVQPYPGSPGYEAVETCLGTPDARARTAGVVAMRPASQ